jgi:predicted signal transduction protein with EAL and GGDEF domain
MENIPAHEIELYPPESFKTLLDHEVNRSRRYGDNLTLIDLIVETDPATPESQHSAEVFVINVLNLQLRNTDIPCKKGNEFLVLLPSTSVQGARTACQRLESLLNVETRTLDRVSFRLSAYIGMATLPGDRSISSDKLTQNASQALEQARASHTTSAVIFPETNQ